MPTFKMKPAMTYALLGSHVSTTVALDEYNNSVQRNEPPPLVDFSGEMVDTYLRHRRVANELVIQRTLISLDKPYSFAPETFVEMRTSLRRRGTGLYSCAERFQREAANYIRGDRPKVSVLPLPVIKDDEMTIKGSTNVTVKFMLLMFLLLKQLDGTFVSPPDLLKRRAVMVGDSLTCERFRNCRDQLLERQTSFNRYFITRHDVWGSTWQLLPYSWSSVCSLLWWTHPANSDCSWSKENRQQ
jgi:hypothetical protein